MLKSYRGYDDTDISSAFRRDALRSECLCLFGGGRSCRVDLGRLGARPRAQGLKKGTPWVLAAMSPCLPLWHRGEGSASPPDADEDIVAFEFGCDEDSRCA